MSWDWEKLREQQQKNDQKSSGPDLEDFFSQFKGIKFPGSSIGIFFIVLACLAAYSSLYTVQTSEVAIIQRFGKYLRTEQPGLHLKWPSPIEKATLVPVERIWREEFGFQGSDTAVTQAGSKDKIDLTDESADNVSLMLTGDLNVAVVPWIVQYRVKDPYSFLFKVNNPRQLLRDMSEACMRLVVGDRSINEVISKRNEIAEETKKILQQELNDAETGILIITVEMKRTNVPAPVQSSFNEVNEAVQQKEKMIYQAKEEYNKVIPAASGEAERSIKTAEGYALDRINRAKGDAEKFKDVLAEYQNAKDVTKRRLYLETLGDLYPRIGRKVVIDSAQKNMMPLLNLLGENKTGDLEKRGEK
ncbi:FtsH protease activity modulator HflK [Desulforegula conservatrix]|uniref:FtsH protease activity modulator HflK n=1 Tax=Desulforegula conservatrix TaxID=153026 RepID=UPI00040DC2D7|nr:FtsH protease activity modulator HflK [Desulforegula conservatrix]